MQVTVADLVQSFIRASSPKDVPGGSFATTIDLTSFEFLSE